MDLLPNLVAAAAAGAILLIALGIAWSGGGSGISTRLERYASGREEKEKAASTSQGPISDLIAQSATIAQLNKAVEQRSFGANLQRELSRADLKLKVGEYMFIWAGVTIGVPVVMYIASFIFPILGNPLVLLVGALIGFLIPRFWLKRRQSQRLNAFNKQLPDTITLIANALRAGPSFLQACELVV